MPRTHRFRGSAQTRERGDGRLRRLRDEVLDGGDQEPRAGALRQTVLALHERGDVAVHVVVGDAGLAREHVQEGSADGGPAILARARLNIVQVGDLAVEEPLELAADREPPERVARPVGVAHEVLGQLVVRGEQAAVGRTERHAGRTREGSEIDVELRSGIILPGEGERIRENEPAFGVRVADLDGEAGHRGQDVARPRSGLGHTVLDGRNDGHDVDLEPQADDRFEGSEHRRRTAHVMVHAEHAFRGLHAQAPGVEADALADGHDGEVRGGIVAPVFENDEGRVVQGALADADDQAEDIAVLAVGHVRVEGLVDHRARTEFRDHGGVVAQLFRAEVVGRRVAQVLCLHDGATDDGAFLHDGHELLGNQVERDRLEARIVLVLPVAVEGVTAVDEVVAQNPGEGLGTHLHMLVDVREGEDQVGPFLDFGEVADVHDGFLQAGLVELVRRSEHDDIVAVVHEQALGTRVELDEELRVDVFVGERILQKCECGAHGASPIWLRRPVWGRQRAGRDYPCL